MNQKFTVPKIKHPTFLYFLATRHLGVQSTHVRTILALTGVPIEMSAPAVGIDQSPDLHGSHGVQSTGQPKWWKSTRPIRFVPHAAEQTNAFLREPKSEICQALHVLICLYCFVMLCGGIELSFPAIVCIV